MRTRKIGLLILGRVSDEGCFLIVSAISKTCWRREMFRVYTKWCWWWFFNTIFCIHKISSQCYKWNCTNAAESIIPTFVSVNRQPGKVVECATETRCETDRLAREHQACSNAKASLPSESTWSERAARWNPVRSQRVQALWINGSNSSMNPRQRKRRRNCTIWKNAGETDGNKKTPLHFWSEVLEAINTIWQRHNVSIGNWEEKSHKRFKRLHTVI